MMYVYLIIVIPSLLFNVPIQTVVEDEDITINLQSVGGPDPFPPLISSRLNGSLLSNTGVDVNRYNVSFINVQRNQSGNYTLTVSNDAGTTNTTFILNVQCKCVYSQFVLFSSSLLPQSLLKLYL